MDNIGVRITADPSGVGPGVATAKSQLGGLEGIAASLNSTFATLGAGIRSAFTGGAASATQMTGAIEKTTAAVNESTAAFGRMSERVHVGGLSFGFMEKAAGPLMEALIAMFAIDKIGEFVNKMGEAAEKVQHLAETFGMSVAQVQQLQGVATATGIPVEALTKGMGILDRNMASAATTASGPMAQAIKAVGVSLNDGRTQMEKLAVVADKFKNMDDGPKKAALAMELFGRSGKELIPVLNLGSAGIEQLNQKMSEYGVVNEDAVAKGAALAESTNETRLGFMGVWNVLTDALAPAFKVMVDDVNEVIAAFIQSYQQGGIVAVVMQTIAAAIEIVVDIVKLLGSIWKTMWDVVVEIVVEVGHIFGDVFGASVPKNVNVTRQILNVFEDTLVIVADAVKIFAETVSGAFRATMEVVATFARVAWDALHLNWGGIEADWQTGMSRVVTIVNDAKNKVVAAASDMAVAIAAAAAGKSVVVGGGIELPKAGGAGSFDYNPTGAAKKAKKPKDDLVQRLEEELEARKTAWAAEQDAQGTAQAYSLQSEADYWAQALSRTDLSAKDRLAVERKYLAARSSLLAEQISAQMDVYKDELSLAGQNWAEKRAVLEQEAAYTARMYGSDSKEARSAAEAVVEAKRQEAAQLRQINEQIAESDDARRLAQIDSAERTAEYEVATDRMTQGQLLRLQEQFEEQRYEVQRTALQRKLQLLLLDPGMNPVEYRKLMGQIEQLQQQHEARMTQIVRAAETERNRVRKQFSDQLAQGWAQTLGQMATLQMGFTKGVQSLWQGLQQAIGNSIASIIQDWLQRQIEALVIGKTQKLAEATGEIGANAGVAASGAYAATAAIPIVGPELAPAAAATAYAGALSWLGSLGALSAEKGDWSVREGLYHLHEKEMVLPSWAAEALRTTLGAGDAPGGGEHNHLHLHGQLITGPREIKRWFENNRHAVGAGAREFVRQGGSPVGRR